MQGGAFTCMNRPHEPFAISMSTISGGGNWCLELLHAGESTALHSFALSYSTQVALSSGLQAVGVTVNELMLP